MHNTIVQSMCVITVLFIKYKLIKTRITINQSHVIIEFIGIYIYIYISSLGMFPPLKFLWYYEHIQ